MSATHTLAQLGNDRFASGLKEHFLHFAENARTDCGESAEGFALLRWILCYIFAIVHNLGKSRVAVLGGHQVTHFSLGDGFTFLKCQISPLNANP